MLMWLLTLATAAELDGAVVYRDNCTRCHSARNPSELDAERWPAVVFHMRTRAGLTAAEGRALVAFLAPPPPSSPPAVLNNAVVLRVCTRCHDAGRIQAAVDSKRTTDLWDATLTRMALYGAALTNEERTALIAWLAAGGI